MDETVLLKQDGTHGLTYQQAQRVKAIRRKMAEAKTASILEAVRLLTQEGHALFPKHKPGLG